MKDVTVKQATVATIPIQKLQISSIKSISIEYLYKSMYKSTDV